MTRLSVLAAVLGILILPAFVHAQDNQPAAQTKTPNILVLYADDLGWGDVSFNGRKTWKTPNLDRLARQGTLFKRWYTAGVTCAPSRAALMTGRYGIHNGVSGNGDDLPRSETTIPEALKPLGYRTALFGKWHHGNPRPGESSYLNPLDHGFDEFFGFTDAGIAWEKYPKELWFGRELRPVNGYADTLFADHAIDFLKQRKSGQPFFLYLAFTNPHFNIEAPESDVAQFKGKFQETNLEEPYNARYAAMVTRLDTEAGRVLKTLDELGLARDTLVIFSSDHGATFEVGNKGASAYHDSNAPFRGQKRNLWEGGIRVPGVVRWPGHVPAGKVSESIVHMTDVFPSLLEAAGGKPDPAWNVDGRSQLAAWTQGTPLPERTLFWEWRSEGYNFRAAMRGDKKLVLSGDILPELYDVVADPGERRNIAAEYPALVRDLRTQLDAWLATESDASKEGKPARAQQTRAGSNSGANQNYPISAWSPGLKIPVRQKQSFYERHSQTTRASVRRLFWTAGCFQHPDSACPCNSPAKENRRAVTYIRRQLLAVQGSGKAG